MERYPCKKDLQEIWLPQEIWREILARLPIRCIMRCWSVCKSWRDLIEGDGLLAKQFLAFVRQDKKGYAVADEDGQPLFQFDLPTYSTPSQLNLPGYSADSQYRLVISSVNGLLLLWDGFDDNHDILFVVNPMTSEYIELPPLPTQRCLFGFGVSKLSGRYKILCVDESKFCHVYTLGGECSWRKIPASTTTRLPPLYYWSEYKHRHSFDYAIFFNGNIHWVACDFENNFLVCCFDLETELFTSFPLQPLNEHVLITVDTHSIMLYLGYRLCVLQDQLCLCDTSCPTLAKLWKMVNYGDASSWIMEYTFKSLAYVTPLKVLSNGDLFFNGNNKLFIYSKNTEACEAFATRDFGFLEPRNYIEFPSIIIYTPSFLSLKTLGIHNVQSLCFIRNISVLL